jgi:probable F420-dependent oxidoreductase
MSMKFGLFGINNGILADPEIASRTVQAVEQAGFESVWTGEHIVLPDPQAPPSPSAPEVPFADTSTWLAFLAGQCESLLLGTGIIILPQRNPVELAKELATVDVASKGRLLFGLGAGYLEPEFRAMGIPFEDRGARTDEYIDALKALWTQKNPTFAGETVNFSGIDAHPRPVQDPHPPIHVGGHSPPAFRRAVRRGNGWYGFFVDHERGAAYLKTLAEIELEEGRDAALGPLEISITPLPRASVEDATRYRDMGVDRLTLIPDARDEDRLMRWIDETANSMLTQLA